MNRAARFSIAAALAIAVCAAQTPKPQLSRQEQTDLESALAEAGSSPSEYLRALEKHMAKYPESPRMEELQRAAVRAAIEANDDRRIILYGERVLTRQPDDLQILERITRALLGEENKDSATRALQHALHYEDVVRRVKGTGADWQNQVDRNIGKALAWEARATGITRGADAALPLAQRSFEVWPCADAAREIARWDERLGHLDAAARALADAFTIPDTRNTDADRARDRGRMGELYRQSHGSEAGLGDLILEAYDRNIALIHTREMGLRANDPNAQLTDPMDFTLTGPDARKLAMASLKGKVVVFDFWATWCAPCRQQHPLYEQVKQRFRSNGDVVFLSVDTDEDHALVKPFLTEVQWSDEVWFEDGLSRALKISTIPTTIVTDKRGKVFSRLNGFVPGKFVDMLSDRIREALIN